MTVLCANCHTANRDRAMFCIGCAGKLPAFAATGPSALEAVTVPSGAGKSRPAPLTAAPAGRSDAAAGHAPRGLMLAVLLLGATVLALAAWISFGPERAAAPGMASAAAPSQAASPAPLQPLPATTVAAPPAVAVPTAVAAAAPATTLTPDAGLSPGESMVAASETRSNSTAPTNAPRQGSGTASTGADVVNRDAPLRQAAVDSHAPGAPAERVASVNNTRPAPRGASDPRAGCEHLFFVLAARCEASHCDDAAYARHPRCTVVREQRRRDEARRNLINN